MAVPSGGFGVNFDDAAIEHMLNDINGPVGDFLRDISEKMAAHSKAQAPVMKVWNAAWKANQHYGPPGRTKAGTHAKVGYGSSGKLYGGVNAPYGPTLFLEKPAKQLHHSYPFLSSSLYAVTI